MSVSGRQVNMIQEAEKEKLTFETIGFMRFPLTVMVVFIHIMGPNGHPSDWGHLTGMDVCNLIRSFGTNVFPHIAVPAFFLISGYLFYKRLEQWDWNVWKKKMHSRIKTLIVPYFIWCLLYVLWNTYLKAPILRIGAFIVKGEPLDAIIDYWRGLETDWLHVLWDSSEWGGDNINWFGELVAHNTGPAFTPFWFMRDLIVVVLLSPFLFWFIKHMGFWFVGILGLIFVSGVWPDIHGLGSTALFFFSLGAWFTLKGHDLCSSLYRYRWTFYLPYLVLLPIMVFFDGRQTYGGMSVFVILGVLSAICFSYFLVSNKGAQKSSFLESSSLFVFAFHYFILVDCGRLIRSFVGTSALEITIVYFLQPLFTVVICLMVFYMLRRWSPRICGLLTGGR